ncbi:MAG: hypothetical protein RJB66_1308 [Pseudomonadota bacterium]
MQKKVKNIFADWSKALKIQQLKADLNALADDMAKVKKSIVPQAKQTVKKAEKEYQKILAQLTVAQKQWNLEVKKAGAFLKKTTKDVEKTVKSYQKIAAQQKAEIKKSVKVTPKAKTVKPTVKVTVKPAAKKATVATKAKKVAKPKAAAKVKVAPKAKGATKAEPQQPMIPGL